VTDSSFGIGRRELTLLDKFRGIQWGLLLLLGLIAGIGFAMLYSAANGEFQPWASRQMIRFGVVLVAVIAAAVIDVRFWFRAAYWIYAAALALVFAVDLRGVIGMGAQRWIDLGFLQLQPSEVMKIALVLALARYFHCLPPDNIGRLRYLLVPVLMIAVPVLLVLKQPDLGTAMMLLVAGGALLFLAGVPFRMFAVAAAGAIAAAPLAWSMLRGYQKSRLYTFLDPERDPLGAGYHIIQSKIALGSGGVWGKGFLRGTQSQLSFLPEKQTDFVFTMLAEEAGLIGALGLLLLFLLLMAYGFAFALRARNHFGRLLALGITATLFLYVFINVAMVTGLIPVVGVPLPMISYGGTAMATVLVGFGLMLGVDVHREIAIPRFPMGRDL
jgi:rod shape determining protein RodA